MHCLWSRSSGGNGGTKLEMQAEITVSVDNLPCGGDVKVEVYVTDKLVTSTGVTAGEEGAAVTFESIAMQTAGVSELVFKLVSGDAVQGTATLDLGSESTVHSPHPTRLLFHVWPFCVYCQLAFLFLSRVSII